MLAFDTKCPVCHEIIFDTKSTLEKVLSFCVYMSKLETNIFETPCYIFHGVL